MNPLSFCFDNTLDSACGDMRKCETGVPRPGRLLLLVALLAVGLVALFTVRTCGLSWHWFTENREVLRLSVTEHFTAALIGYFAVCVLVIAVSFPFVWMLHLTAGAIFGLAWGMAVMCVATAIGAMLSMLLGRYLFRDLTRTIIGQWVLTIDRGIARDGAFYLWLLRLTPLVPFVAINLGVGLTRMRPQTFWLVSQIGVLPGIGLFVYAGSQLDRIESPKEIYSGPMLGALLALGVAPLVIRQIISVAHGRIGSMP